MIILQGILRQAGLNEYEGKKKTKLWVEHTSPRENGVADLKLEELFLEGDCMAQLPKTGAEVSVSVRPYALGKIIKFSANALVPSGPPVPVKA
jgi:hypothetical protein